MNREKTNARHLEPADFDPPPSLATIDVSFISLRLILPAAARILAPGGELVALVKPQFEVGKGEVGKGGIVRDEELRRGSIDGVARFAQEPGIRARRRDRQPHPRSGGKPRGASLRAVARRGARPWRSKL